MKQPLYNWLGFKTENEMINDAGYQFYGDPQPRYEFKDFVPAKDLQDAVPTTAVAQGNIAPMVFTKDKMAKLFSGEGKVESPTGVITLETDPSGKPLNSPGAKADAGKLRPWLVLGSFSHALEEVSKVGTAGAKKYTPNGWKTVEDAQERYMEAFGRHLLELGKGNEIDDGPNGVYTHHIANMIWNLCAVLELKLSEKSASKT